ncbi:MAG TPA: protein-glutamate O-methyltransferase CheR [Candidatus Micrarchaeaceae archaeon]|nr:protein-glutamate O-methyltransferase CheR [Candidatus Micrarchaeaceae archaeon]
MVRLEKQLDNATALNVEEIEIKLLLQGVAMRYGYDFREYALGPLRRTIASGMAGEGVGTISAYQERLLHDASCMQRFLSGVGVNVTSMFREADVLRCIRDEAIPRFRTYPSLRIWIAGCATGEEVYSMAIMLREEGLYERSQIYATDINESSLAIARAGAYPLARVVSDESSHARSGGQGRISDFYSITGKTARFDHTLQSHITWARHNLVSDSSFNEFHLILCANVLIYFRPNLQERAHRLFYDSLVRSGYLGLGQQDSLVFCPESSRYEQLRDEVHLFHKVR